MTSSVELAPYEGNAAPPPRADVSAVLDMAKVFVQSGFFQDVKSLSQAAVKIMAGQELGFGPFASLNGVYIISGRTALAANLMAHAIKRTSKYDYRVVELTNQACSIEFYENGQAIGTSTFTLDDAKRAGTKNIDKFPRNMLFARALSNGAKWYCPDAFGGAQVYAPEEFGLEQRDDGSYIEQATETVTEAEVVAIAEPRRKAEPQPVAEPEPEPAPVNRPPGLYVTSHKIAKKTNEFTLFVFTTSDGVDHSTFSESVFKEVQRAKAEGKPISYEEEAGNNGKKRVVLVEVLS